MFLLPGQATSHRQEVQRLQNHYDLLIKNGTYLPFGYPFGLLPAVIVIGFLVLPRRWSTTPVRHGAAAAAILNCLWAIFFTRARNASTSGLLGIIHVWYILVIFAHLVAVDPKEEYFRVGVRGAISSKSLKKPESDCEPEKEQGPKQAMEEEQSEKASTSDKTILHYWEPFPNSFTKRFDWALDLSTSLDGIGWTWAIETLPNPPIHVYHELYEDSKNHPLEDANKLSSVVRRWGPFPLSNLPVYQPTEAQVFCKFTKTFVIGYIVLDIVKTLGSVDPYFWGYVDFSAPPYIPVRLQYPMIIRTARMYIALMSVQLAIQTLLTLRPLYFLYRSPKSVGVLGEAWMHPSSFGSFQSVLDYGLAGFWGYYWHQSFRYIFLQPSKVLLRTFYDYLSPSTAKLLKFYIAFFCSGLLHACLSYTAIGQTSPLRGPLMFFLLQPIGILLQRFYLRAFRATAYASRCPRWLGWAGNLLWTHVWGYLTAPLLIEDLARGGQFLFEPIPFSVLRGLGLGNADDGFYCWHGRWFSWQSDSRWARIVS